MVKHRSTGEPDEQSEILIPVGPEHKPGDGLKILNKLESRPDESDEVLVCLLPPDRQGPGELIKVPKQNFGFAITVNDVLYVHVSDAVDGTYQYVPFSAK